MFCGDRRGFKKTAARGAHCARAGCCVSDSRVEAFTSFFFFFFDQLWADLTLAANFVAPPNSFPKPAQPAARSPGSRGAAISSK